MLDWLRNRRQSTLRAKADAESLVCDHGAGAYLEARQRQYEASADEIEAYWNLVALRVARMIRKQVGLDTTTGMVAYSDDG